jgi:hypothetical protein
MLNQGIFRMQFYFWKLKTRYVNHVINYKLFIRQICFEEDGNYSPGQETPLIVRNPSSYLRTQKSRHLGSKQNQMKQVNSPYFQVTDSSYLLSAVLYSIRSYSWRLSEA